MTPQSELAKAREAHAALLTKRARFDASREAISDEAIAAARQQIAAIEAAIEREQSRCRARDACLHLPEFVRLAEACDAHLEALVRDHAALKSLAQQLHDATGTTPHMRSFQLSSANALASALVLSDLRTEIIAPGRRRSFARCASEWAKSVEAAASGKVDQ
jgi:hypothetical protein